MTDEQFDQGQRIKETISKLEHLDAEINERIGKLSQDSSEEDIKEYFTLLVSNGFGWILRKAILKISENIEKDIKELQEEFDNL